MDELLFYYFLGVLPEDVGLDKEDGLTKCKRTISFGQSIFSRTDHYHASDPQPRILCTGSGLHRYYRVCALFSMSWIPTGDHTLPTVGLYVCNVYKSKIKNSSLWFMVI